MEQTNKNKVMQFLRGKQYPFIAIGVALLISGCIIKAMGFDPFLALKSLLSGALGTTNAWGETLIKMIPLIFTALSFSVAMKSGIVNLGATGQVYIGSLAGTLIATNFAGLPAIIHIPLALIAGMAAGGAYGWLAIALKNKFGANELVTTIMLNYIAIQFVNYMVSDPIRDYGATTALPQSRMVTDTAVLTKIIPNTRLHIGLFIAIAALILYYILFWHTTKGYELKVTGLSQSVSKYAGMNVKKNQTISMVMAGALAGMCGVIEILAIQSRITQDWAGDIGFDGVAVALLGGNTPVGIGLSAFLFGMLSSGANKMQMMAKVPNAVIYLVQGLVVLFVVGRNIFIWKSKKKNEKKIEKMKQAVHKEQVEV
ncbi:ABC transporter permease [Hespellia stercorisuis]|uniref:Simple sugar transport system permease protein n=1 Tax=Hespellia stercorisuis DSM 15480 TaxID=1121950 RepID=A0A1M6VD43_9FIRM|nr:ABC transporter permease [Hespellia stercorisuis]SHK79457.1 simple sugar transport system permease protein [Hespellia stercorisuis DSM 15480]